MLAIKRRRRLKLENWSFLKNKVSQKIGPTAQKLFYEHILECNGNDIEYLFDFNSLNSS